MVKDLSEHPIYLDFNATTPLAPEVGEAMRPFLTGVFGNPSSDHPFGAEAKRILESSRRDVAKMLGAEPDEIIFTSGGTEANNLAIMGVCQSPRAPRGHVICSTIEHPSVAEVMVHLERAGFRVTRVGVDAEGRVDPADVAAAITPDTILVSIMLANNEVGSVQPIREISELAHANGAYMHTDAAQAVRKLKVRVQDLGVDLLSIAGHKFYAPKGVGALYIRTGVALTRQTHGAGHERGLRPGTENVMFAAAIAAACRSADQHGDRERAVVAELRDDFERRIIERLGHDLARVNAMGAERLPNTSSVSFRGVEANTLLAEIGDRVAASAGAACHAGDVDLSAVLSAMGLELEWAKGTVRFSLGSGTTAAEVALAASVVCDAVERLGGTVPDANRTEGPATVRLTQFTQGMGCACKVRPQLLQEVLSAIPMRDDDQVMVDMSTSDDAGVFRLAKDLALVQTVDFLTPVVDNPYDFGQIAAANALSDVYAMGGTPLYAVSIVGFPTRRLGPDVLKEILRGAAATCDEAGVSIIGGHTIEDPEPKFGLAVTATVAPDRILRNTGARVGDLLVLTKPIGTGIVATGIKRGLADGRDGEEMVGYMKQLNRAAAQATRELAVHACTDVTGFGLLGHLLEMTTASKVNAEIYFDAIPILRAAHTLASAGAAPGGTRDNLEYLKDRVRFDDALSRSSKWILADAQTSGGLLISIAENDADKLLDRLRGGGVARAAVIGSITAVGEGAIKVFASRAT